MNAVDASKLYDVAIVGGGLVGIPMALALSRDGFSVLLIERQALSQPIDTAQRNSFDERSTALSLGSVELLKSLGLWDEQATEAYPIQTVHVSEQGRMGATRITTDDMAVDALGYVVPNMAMGNHLYAQLQASEVSVLEQGSVDRITFSAEAASLTVLKDEAPLSFDCKLLVLADGANSRCADKLGMRYTAKPYHQHAIVTNVETELENQGVAYERFTQAGPAALLPLKPNISALVWTVPSSDCEAILGLDDQAVARRVSELMGERLGRVTHVGKRVSYPLQLTQIEEQARERLLVVGNAAHSLHPVAGQGFNLALRGVAGYVEQLCAARANNEAFWSLSVLNQWVTKHRSEQFKIVSFSDQLIELFSGSSSIPALARSMGLVALNNVQAIKSEFGKHTMGRAQRFDPARGSIPS